MLVRALKNNSRCIASTRRISRANITTTPACLQKRIPLPEKSTTIEKFHFSKNTHTINSVSSDYAKYTENDLEVTLYGWLDSKPKKISKQLIFANFRDQSGKSIQVMVSDAEALLKKFNKLRVEDALVVTGKVRKRLIKEGVNVESVEKEQLWELKLSNVQNLNHASVVASQLESLKKTSLFDFPPEYRYLQLRQREFQEILQKRSLAANTIRKEFIDNGFVEVETPLLFKSTPEGAREFLVPTRTKNAFYALPQSPQQYKQLLMASGVPKYFQIAKCFRDEDLRADRQPEFTQVDLEMAFATAEDVQSVVEKLICATWSKVRNILVFVPKDDDLIEPFDISKQSISYSFPKLTYTEALSKYGIDKPDLRSTLKFINISDFVTSVENESFPVIEVCVLKGAFEQNLKSVAFSEITDSNQYKARKPKIIAIQSEEDCDFWFKKVESDNFVKFDKLRISELKQLLGLQPGDIIACSNRAEFPYENPTPLGRFRQVAIGAYPGKWQRQIVGDVSKDLKPEDVFVASWVIDFPLFNPEDITENSVVSGYPKYDFSKFVSTHHPFTMLKLEDYDYLKDEKDFLKIKGDHYDLVINGVEVGGGSRRIHDTSLQNYIFHNVLKIKNPEVLFGHLLKAFDLGCPPHAGLAIGFDRMVAMLLGHSSIKNVIAFPKNQSGSDLVVGSPSKVENNRLKDYKIRVSS